MPCPPRISPPLHCARQAAPDDLLGQGMSPGHEHWKQKSSQICLHLCESANTKSCSTLIISKHSSAEEEISIDCIAVTTCWGFTTVGIEYWPSCWCCLWQSWECRLVGNCPAELLTVYIDKAFLQGIGEDLCGEPSHVCFHHLASNSPCFSKLWDWVDILKNLSYKYMLKSYI